MRNLTIKRTKSFVGSLMKMKVYIEDPVTGEIAISGVPCRKIGELKNGEEKTFEIDENSVKVFVIGDKLSRNYCNDFFEVPAGVEDVFLSGKNKYNPAAGNAFRFDNNPSQAAGQNRKKGLRKGILVLIIAVIVGWIIGGFIGRGLLPKSTGESKVFTDEGVTITLTDEFIHASYEGYTTCYDSENVAVFMLKEAFSEYEGIKDLTLDDYAKEVIKNNSLKNIKFKNENGLTYFEYQFYNEEDETTYDFYSFVYKTEDAFWLIQFATAENNVEQYNDTIFEWAKTIEFAA